MLRIKEVYPRVCGGTCRRDGVKMVTFGLSPRVRGNPAIRPLSNHKEGSIPACAGEPDESDPRTYVSGVYPRVCGGTPDCRSQGTTKKGLSPRVRGNRESKAGEA